MAVSTLSIGISGLSAAQAGILTTGHNISNASTAGYTRQQIVQEAVTPMFTGSGFMGQGTNVDTVKRVYNQYLTSQVLAAQTGAAEMSSYQAQIEQIDNLVADPSAGLSPSLASFFDGVEGLAANPSSTPSRQALLSASQSLVARFQSINTRFDEIRAGTNSQITNEVDLINSYAQQISNINQQIALAQVGGDSKPPNDLFDQRDQLINSLNKEIRVSTVTQSDGALAVFIGNGQPLVVGTQVTPLKAVQDANEPLKTSVALVFANGKTSTLSDSMLTGGTLGGLIAFRSQTLDAAQNALGRVAIGLAQSVNDQHKLGQDLSGALGGNFFNVPTPAVYPGFYNTSGNATVAVTINSVANLTTSDYMLTSMGGGNYNLVRLSDNAVLVSNTSLPASVDGMVITPSAVPNNGDTFLIQPTRPGARDLTLAINDPRKLAIASPIRTSAALTNTGTGSIDSGVVTSVTATPPPSAITLRYIGIPAPALDGFPVGATVDPGTGILYKITSPTTQVPYTIGNNISFNDIGVTLTGAPVHGDSFTINPQPAGAITPVVNTGLASMFGVPAAAANQGASIGAVAPAIPLTITGGALGLDDQFDITINGVGPVTKTVAAGTYTTALALANAIQAAIGGGTTVSVNPTNGKLMVTSNLIGGATAIALAPTAGNTGYTKMFGGASVAGLRNQVTSGLALTNPTDIKAGINDTFDVNIDGFGLQTVLVPAGSYTPANLATQMQTTINALVAAPGVSVSVNGANQLIVMSNTVGGASSVALSVTPAGTGVMAAGATTRTELLPAAPITLTYNKATNSLTGFPVGSQVTIAGDPLSPYSITSTIDKVTYTPGATMSFNGMSIAISGSLAEADVFTVGPNSSGVSDNRNALLIGKLQTAKLLEGSSTTTPTASFQASYAEMVSQVGNKAREVKVGGESLLALAEQTQTSRDSVSAVNLDEEAANLLRYQQAYQASSKLISIAGKLFDSLLAI